MSTLTRSVPNVPRSLHVFLALVLAIALSGLLPSALLAADPTAAPEVGAAPGASLTPAEAACESAEDLRLIIGFLRDADVSVDGWLPVLVGVIAGLSEARTLAGLVGETYRPLVDDLVVSLEGLRSTVEGLDEMETAGARIAVIGEAITDIGNTMDALSTQLRAPCPTPAAVASPSAG